jgi:hypothetical protein
MEIFDPALKAVLTLTAALFIKTICELRGNQMNGATVAAAGLVLGPVASTTIALCAPMAERHDRHCFQEADRVCQDAGIGGYNGCLATRCLIGHASRLGRKSSTFANFIARGG